MNRFIIAETSRCIGCRTCEVACAVSHSEDSAVATINSPTEFTPRLKLVKTSSVSAPVMCRQCEDPPCAKVCPNDAIVQEDNYVKVIQSRCIGCKTCAVACPYGAMDVVTKMVEQSHGEKSLFNRSVCQSQALKCDLCSHREQGPACMEVCPTDALMLVSPDEVESLKKKKRIAAVDQAVSMSV